jgi:predicted esterase
MEETVTTKTERRFFSLGKDNKINLSVWFVFHGYGMRADEFLGEFEGINDGQTLIIAPEGLHRFYSRGTRGKVVATWMTSDLREFDISNNLEYLELVSTLVKNYGLSESCKVGVLGFSQGAPTALRWVAETEMKVSEVVVWGSDLPSDVIDDVSKLKKLNTTNMKLVIGSKDEYISSDQTDDLIMDLHERGVDFDFHTFEGSHELHEETVRYFHARLVDEKSEY